MSPSPQSSGGMPRSRVQAIIGTLAMTLTLLKNFILILFVVDLVVTKLKKISGSSQSLVLMVGHGMHSEPSMQHFLLSLLGCDFSPVPHDLPLAKFAISVDRSPCMSASLI